MAIYEHQKEWFSLSVKTYTQCCLITFTKKVLFRRSNAQGDTTLFARELLVTCSGRISRHAALYAEDGFVYIHVVHYILDRATYAFYLLGNFSVLH